jgi:NitT/TauT family transport system permease protein
MSSRRPPRLRHWRERLTSVAVFIVLMAAGEILLPLFKVPAYILPTPSAVLRALTVDLSTASFWSHTLITLREIIVGCLAGSLLGFVLGVLLTQSAFLEAVLTPYIVAVQSVPKVALAPVIVVMLGYGEGSKEAIAAIVSFFPLLVNVTIGIRGADEGLLELMRGLRASRVQTLRWVQLPAALPTIFGGLEVAVVFSVVGAIVGEFTGASGGLGYLIDQRSFSLNQAAVFSTLIVLSVMGLALDALVRWVSARVVRWQRVGEVVGM